MTARSVSQWWYSQTCTEWLWLYIYISDVRRFLNVWIYILPTRANLSTLRGAVTCWPRRGMLAASYIRPKQRLLFSLSFLDGERSASHYLLQRCEKIGASLTAEHSLGWSAVYYHWAKRPEHSLRSLKKEATPASQYGLFDWLVEVTYWSLKMIHWLLQQRDCGASSWRYSTGFGICRLLSNGVQPGWLRSLWAWLSSLQSSGCEIPSDFWSPG